jgi:hypothetical protein
MPSVEPDRLLAIYLNDHLAGATLGVALAQRLRASNEGDPVFGDPLAEICAEIETDRTTLVDLMGRLGVRRDPFKPAIAWMAERLGRLKLNGRLRGYSPLSRLLELDVLAGGVSGKLQLWRTLERTLVDGPGELDFARLAERAAGQRDRLEALQRDAADRALPSARPPSGRPD